MKSNAQHFFANPLFNGRKRSLLFLLIISVFVSLPETNWAKSKEANAEKAPTTASKNAAASPAQAPPAKTLMPGDRCTGDPKFLEKIGFSKRAMVDTTSTHRVGLLVTDVTPQGRPGRSTQHESWTQGGFLGRVQRDRDGNVYTYPAPSVTLAFNPVEKSNIVYRVDSETGVMTPFAELPKAAPATEQNPFGLLALALDCEQNALYAASVYGSTASAENGVIAKIDLTTQAVTIVRRGLDALSLLIAFDQGEKRLFVGSARDNAIISYAIGKDGSLGASETVEIRLDEIAAAQDKRARVLRIDGRGRLYVRAIPFEYNLAARSTIPTTEMNFALNVAEGKKSRFTLIDQKTTEVPAPSPPQIAPTAPGSR